jgi:hypothetical protein
MAPKELVFEGALLLLLLTYTINMLTAYFLPKLLAKDLYVEAYWSYDETTRFDNSFLTYGTDYFLAVVNALGAASILYSCSHSKLRTRCALLLILYSISVTTGGIAHQFIDTLSKMNSINFRFIWFICVGTVTMAGACIGAIGSQIACAAAVLPADKKRFNVPIIPDWVWVFWGVSLTVLVWFGGLSMKRPACDIFVAGTTQTAPSTYVFLSLLSRSWGSFKPSNKDSTRFFLDNSCYLMMIGYDFSLPILCF